MQGDRPPVPGVERPHAAWALARPSVWLQFLHQTWLNIKSAKVHYLLGFLACWLVVVVVAVLVSLLNQTPVIFLRLSESSRSEIDLKIDAATITGFSRLNYTLAKSLLTEPDEQWTSPRTSRARLFTNPSQCQYASSDNKNWLYSPMGSSSCSVSCPVANCPGTKTATVRRKPGLLFCLSFFRPCRSLTLVASVVKRWKRTFWI